MHSVRLQLMFSDTGWRCVGALFTGSKRQERAAVLNEAAYPVERGQDEKKELETS